MTSALSSAAGVVTIDLSLMTARYELSLTENVTSWVFSNVPASGSYKQLYIDIIQDPATPRTVVTPATTGRTATPAWVVDATLSSRETLMLQCYSDASRALYATGIQV